MAGCATLQNVLEGRGVKRRRSGTGDMQSSPLNSGLESVLSRGCVE